MVLDPKNRLVFNFILADAGHLTISLAGLFVDRFQSRPTLNFLHCSFPYMAPANPLEKHSGIQGIGWCSTLYILVDAGHLTCP
jgi:hypothetical protein